MAKVKKVLKFVFLVLLVLFAFRSCSYASLSDSLSYNEIDFTGTKQDALEKIWTMFNYDWDQSNNQITTSQTNQTTMLGYLGSRDYMIVGHQIVSNGNNSWRVFDLWLSSNDHVSQNSCQQFFSLQSYGPSERIPAFQTFATTTRGYTVTLNSTTYDYVLKYNNGTWLEYSVNDNTIAADTFDFSPNYDAITNYNGYEQLYAKKYDYSINNWLMGEMTPSEKYNQYDIQLLDTGGNIIFRDRYNQEYGTNTNNNLFISTLDKKLYVKSMVLSYNKIYTLIIYPLDNEGNITSNNFVGTFMYLPLNATISGDSILALGSGDYTIQDNANAVVDTINNLFTLSSGDINDIYSDVVAYFPSGDRPDQIYDIIFGTLNSEPSDFVISWGNIPVMLTVNGGQTVFSGDLISGDSINFSKLCRENETMMLIKFYLNLFVMIFFTIAYLSTLYKCLLIMLGLSTDFVGDLMEPEHRQIGFINDWRDK